MSSTLYVRALYLGAAAGPAAGLLTEPPQCELRGWPAFRSRPPEMFLTARGPAGQGEGA